MRMAWCRSRKPPRRPCSRRSRRRSRARKRRWFRSARGVTRAAMASPDRHQKNNREETMSQRSEFHNLENPVDGLLRELASGVTTRIFSGEQAMLSVVTIAPNAQGTLHHHPEEQWGVLLEGSAIRVQGSEEIEVKK